MFNILSKNNVLNSAFLRILQFKKRDNSSIDLSCSNNTLPVALLFKLCILERIHNVLHKPYTVSTAIRNIS